MARAGWASRRGTLTLLFATCAACAGAEPALAPPVAATRPSPVELAPAAPPITTEKLAADAPRATVAGTTFTAPAGWTLRSGGRRRLLDGPEPDVHLALVDVGEADSAAAAVAAAWPALVPDFKRAVKVAPTA